MIKRAYNWTKEKVVTAWSWTKRKAKQILIGLGIIGVVSATSILGPGPAPQTPLIEVPITQIQVDEIYAHRFQDKTTGKIFERETTKLEYDALAEKNAGQPTYFNATWILSYGGQPVYVTSTPILLDYQFVIVASTTGKVLIKMPGLSERIIDKSFIVDNKLTEEGLTELQK